MLALLGIALFLVALGGIGWLAWHQASAADVLAAKMEQEQEAKRKAQVNAIEARRAKLRDAINRGTAA